MTPHAQVMYIRENLLITQTIVPKIAKRKSVLDSPQKNRIDSNDKNEYYQCEKKCEHKPLTRRKGQALNDPSQASIITMFNAMKRKLTPGKEEDTPREHLKIQRNEPTNI